MWAHPYFREETSHAVHHRCEHTHTSERKPHMLYIIGVSTPIPQRGNLKCLKYVVGVRSLNTFQQAVLLLLFVFFYMGAILRFPWKRRVWVWMGTPTMYGQVYLLKRLYKKHGCGTSMRYTVWVLRQCTVIVNKNSRVCCMLSNDLFKMHWSRSVIAGASTAPSF